MKIQIILGSTRPNRKGESVAKWAHSELSKRDDIEFELVDIADYNLPLLDEPKPAGSGEYTKEHTKRWSEKINQADGYIFVTAEYNHSIPGALKNALDFLFHEWKYKAVGFISYGSIGGSRAAEQLRLIAGQFQMADVRQQLMLFTGTDFEGRDFQPTEKHKEQLGKLADDVASWSSALQTLRTPHSQSE